MENCIVTDTKNNKSQQPTEEIVGTVVYIETEIETANWIGGRGGSGFFVARDKIVTNCHVLLDAITVIAKDIKAGTTYTIEGITAFNTENDVVILKTSDGGIPFQLGDSAGIQLGEPICVLGYPEEERSRADGVLMGFLNHGKRVRFKASVGPGYSGGPVLNSEHEVIAIHRGSRNKSGDDGIAIPSNAIKALLTEAEAAKIEPLSVWQKRYDVLILMMYNLYEWGSWYKRTVGMLRLIWHVVKGIFYSIHASIKASSDDYPASIAIYDKIIASKLIPFLGAAYAYRGMAKSELGNYQDAIEDANEAILLEPESYNGYYSRGYVNQGLSKSKADQGDIMEARKLYRAAINDFTEAISLKPEKAKIYNSRGWSKYLFGQLETEQGNVAAAQSRYQEAISDSDEALHLQPKSAKFRAATYHTRGVAKVSLGDHNGAVEDFDESIRLNPKKALYYHDCGLAKEALGEHEAAKVDFVKAAELNPDFAKHP